jgi:thiamine kinase-like enzyme
VCPENVVFRNGLAVALVDFDFAAPGRPLYDLACMARMCVPLDTPQDAAASGRSGLDPFRRLRVAADAYGLAPARTELVTTLETDLEHGGEFVRRRVDRGEPAFVAMWVRIGGQGRYDRRREWFAANRERFLDALG